MVLAALGEACAFGCNPTVPQLLGRTEQRQTAPWQALLARESLSLQTGKSGEKFVFFLASVFRQYSFLCFSLAVVADRS